MTDDAITDKAHAGPGVSEKWHLVIDGRATNALMLTRLWPRCIDVKFALSFEQARELVELHGPPETVTSDLNIGTPPSPIGTIEAANEFTPGAKVLYTAHAMSEDLVERSREYAIDVIPSDYFFASIRHLHAGWEIESLARIMNDQELLQSVLRAAREEIKDGIWRLLIIAAPISFVFVAARFLPAEYVMLLKELFG